MCVICGTDSAPAWFGKECADRPPQTWLSEISGVLCTVVQRLTVQVECFNSEGSKIMKRIAALGSRLLLSHTVLAVAQASDVVQIDSGPIIRGGAGGDH
jgi:hypothetical protein